MHKQSTHLLSRAIQAALLGVTLAAAASTATAAEETFHWGYGADNGPHIWGLHFEGCNGNSQSPIDIVASETTSVRGEELETSYRSRALNVQNNGHTIQVNVAPGSTLRVGNKSYGLLQFHFHTGSEHTLNGNQAPMEVHFVHMDDSGKLGVVGFLFRESDRSNSVLETIIANAPLEEGKHALEEELNYGSLVREREVESYYNYSGSLTTPPCSEGVNWFVAKQRISATVEQIEAMRELMVHHSDPGNYRPTQLLNGREVRNVRDDD